MGYKILCLFICLFFGVSAAFPEEHVSVDYNDFLALENVDKKDVKKLKSADAYFSYGPEYYQLALPVYLELANDTIEYAPMSWRIAMCYLHTDEKDLALDYVLKCDKTVSLLYYFYLAKAYHFRDSFELAKENYQLFIETSDIEPYDYLYRTYGVKKEKTMTEIINTLIASCDRAIESKSEKWDYTFTPIADLNSTYDEIFPVLYNDSLLLYASSKKAEVSNRFKIYQANFDDSLVVSNIQLSSFHKVAEDDSRVPLPNHFCGVDTFLFQSMLTGGDIMYSYRNKRGKLREWHVEHINEVVKEGSACLINESTMVLSSERAGEPEKADLFIVSKNAKGEWGQPSILRGEVNTSGREEVITYFEGDLYYISNGPGSLGGFDIYKVRHLQGNQWGDPVNLGYPINTAENDMSYYPISSTFAVYSGIRIGGVGACDLYWVETTPK
jgi:hypothetical protein